MKRRLFRLCSFTTFFLLFLLGIATTGKGRVPNAYPDPLTRYPVLGALGASKTLWLESDGFHPQGTSGISFVRNAGAEREFLLADDDGTVWSLFLRFEYGEPYPRVVPLRLSRRPEEAERRLDLEGIAWDSFDSLAYAVSEPREKGRPSRIWRLRPSGRSLLLPQSVFDSPHLRHLLKKYSRPNRGLEAIAVGRKWFFLGFEGSRGRNPYLAVVNRKTGKLITLHNMKHYGMASLTGMAAVRSGLLLLDRDRDEICRVDLSDTDASIRRFRRVRIEYSGPSGERFSVHTPEGLALDADGNLWVVIDPWKYRPRKPPTVRLSIRDRRRYKEKIPMVIFFNAPAVRNRLGDDVALPRFPMPKRTLRERYLMRRRRPRGF